MKPRFYVDTSAIGGCLDPEFQAGSQALLTELASGGAMATTEKRVDCVRLMREIRDRLSTRFENMSYEQRRRYIDERLKAASQSAPSVPKPSGT